MDYLTEIRFSGRLTEIRFSGQIPLAHVYAAITNVGAQRIRRGSGYFACPVDLTEQQLGSLRPGYPKHAKYLRGEVWIWVEDGTVVVGGSVHAYDTICGRLGTGPDIITPENLSEEQKGKIAGLAAKIENGLKARGGLEQLATQT